MEERVIGEVVLRSADGSSALDLEEPINAENIAKYQVGKELVDEASTKLEALGFRVEQAGVASVTISGERPLFERVFQTTLKIRSKDALETKVEGVEALYYEAAKPIRIPEDLSSLMADVVLPTPPELFA